jgi:Mg2+ and Co2+ transporter CorA
MEQVRALSTVVIADSIGVRPVATTTDLHDLVTNIDFCWVDLSVGDEAVRADVLGQLGLDPSDLSWALRFGQRPRMVIDRRGPRAVTWLAQPGGDVAEVHVLCSPRGVVTVWSGDPAALDEARAHFAERAAELNKERGAAELNDYADQVEDTEHRLNDRSQWASSVLQDYVAAIASARAIRSTGSHWCRSSSFPSRSSPDSSA